MSSCTSAAAIVKQIFRPFWQAASPRPRASWVLPAPQRLPAYRNHVGSPGSVLRSDLDGGTAAIWPCRSIQDRDQGQRRRASICPTAQCVSAQNPGTPDAHSTMRGVPPHGIPPAKINCSHTRLATFLWIWSFRCWKGWNGQLPTKDHAIPRWTWKEYLIHIVFKIEYQKRIRQIPNRFTPSHNHCNEQVVSHKLPVPAFERVDAHSRLYC